MWQTLRRKSHLKTHIESVHEKDKYPCNQCGKQLTSKGLLKTHIESVHKKVKYPYNLCGKKIYNTEQAEKTYWIHLQENLLLTQVGPGRRLAGFN